MGLILPMELVMFKTIQSQASLWTQGAILVHKLLHGKLNSFHSICKARIAFVVFWGILCAVFFFNFFITPPSESLHLLYVYSMQVICK